MWYIPSLLHPLGYQRMKKWWKVSHLCNEVNNIFSEGNNNEKEHIMTQESGSQIKKDVENWESEKYWREDCNSNWFWWAKRQTKVHFGTKIKGSNMLWVWERRTLCCNPVGWDVVMAGRLDVMMVGAVLGLDTVIRKVGNRVKDNVKLRLTVTYQLLNSNLSINL